MHYIIFPIGDWSCDGHNCCAEFLVKSAKPLSEVRNVHFKENSFIGFLCKDYQDNKIEVFSFYSFLNKYLSDEDSQQIIKNLLNSNILIDEELEIKELESRIKNTPHNYSVELSFDKNEDNPQYLAITSPQAMLDIWLLCLNTIDSTIKLECVSEAMSAYFIKYKGYAHKPEGNINFYGVDSENRHLDTPGYGVWLEDDLAGEFYHNVS